MRHESEQSAFNFAVEYLKSISKSLDMCKYAAASADTELWFSWLRTLYRELSAKTKKEEDEAFDVLFGEVRKLMTPQGKRTNAGEIMYKLDNIEIKLRKTLQKKGMLLPSKSDPRFAILER